MHAAKTDEAVRVSVTLSPEIYREVVARAERNNISLNRTILQLLHSGLEAEQEKKLRLQQTLRRYRDSKDPQEVERLGNELGAMIFGE
jgi:hypothetical protein